MPQPKTMKSGSPDNFQTDPRALEYIMPYFPKSWKVWEPACGNENLSNYLRGCGYVVGASDILYGDDFLKWDGPHNWDCIITNPPFSMKEEFLGRCYQLGKPFALLMPITTFDSEDRRKLMAAKGIEVILPVGRINFETPNHEKNKAIGKKSRSWFYTAWFTYGLNIGRQLVFCDAPTMPGI